jgi:hypothetical protein
VIVSMSTRSVRITAQVASGDEAYVALMIDRAKRGPSGEIAIAQIWHTIDRGRTWRMLPWRRTARTFLSRGLFARWPPEWVNRMWLRDSRLEIECFEDNGPDSAGDPIWRAAWDGARWRVRFDRIYDSAIDGGILPKHRELDLPGITTPPALGPFR